MVENKGKKKINFGRILHYFWEALMQKKWATFLLLFLIPIRSLISNIILPRGISDIIGMLSAGEFQLAAYAGVLTWTLVPSIINNMVLVRICDWTDWYLDAVGGKYLIEKAFDAVIRQSMRFHSDHFSGSLTSQANKLSSAYITFKSVFAWDLYPLFLTTAFSLIVMFVICAPFGAIMTAFVAAYVVVASLVYFKTTHYEEKMAKAENKMTGQLADSITNVMSVKSYAHEKHEKRRFAEATARTKKATLGLAKASFYRNLSLNSLGSVTFVVLIFLVVMGHNLFGLNIADTVYLFTLSNSLLSSVWQINHILRSMNRAFGDANEMVEILDMPYIIDDKTDVPIEVTDAGIEFEHISFTHEEQKDKLFSDFSLSIAPGTSVGLVGISGSGKSTLTKLLLRFDDVKKGAIFIDGQDIRDVTQESLRNAIAYVPQESALFHRSVYDNILYGRPDATEEEVYEAARLANADEFIAGLPDGYDTMVGERGVKLSGGQRQRIAIARAILKDAPILVLDEATSALDSESEAAIQEALANLMEGRTSIVVAHRLSTIAGLDKIVVLNDGKIIEEGSHAELLSNDGEYAKLWNRQSGAFLE